MSAAAPNQQLEHETSGATSLSSTLNCVDGSTPTPRADVGGGDADACRSLVPCGITRDRTQGMRAIGSLCAIPCGAEGRCRIFCSQVGSIQLELNAYYSHIVRRTGGNGDGSGNACPVCWTRDGSGRRRSVI